MTNTDKGNKTVDIASDRVIMLTVSLGRINIVQSGVISVNLANIERARLTGAATLDLTGLAIAKLLTGNDGADRLTSLGGADTLAGGQGHAALQGGTAKDVRRGDLGSDVFFFATKEVAGFGDGCDSITDFASGTDKPDFHSFMDSGQFIGNAFFSAGHGPPVPYLTLPASRRATPMAMALALQMSKFTSATILR